MARIRSIKPSFWSDEKMAPQPPAVRLVFLGLLCMADDEGRTIDNVKAIDAFIYPETEDTAREALGVLAELKRIVRYTTSNGQRAIQIVNWRVHQRIDNPRTSPIEAPATLGGSVGHATSTLENSVAHASAPRESSVGHAVDGDRDGDRERDGEGDETASVIGGPMTAAVPGVALTLVRGTRGRSAVPVLGAAASHVVSVLGGFLDSVHRGAVQRVTVEDARRVMAGIVFAYWAAKMGKDLDRTVLDAKREKRIEARLQENRGDVSELLFAIDGARRDKHLMGANDAGRKYDGIETVLRDRAQVERLASTCPEHRRGEPHPMAAKYREALAPPPAKEG